MSDFFKAVRTLCAAEWLLGGRRGLGLLGALLFFILAAALFPLALGPWPDLLTQAGVGALWMAAFFASLLTQDQMWTADLRDGTLDLYLLSPLPLAGIALGKMLAHWSLAGLLPALAVPLAAPFFNLDGAMLMPLSLALALGTLVLSLGGGVVGALVLGARVSGTLLPLLLLPLYVPVLVFGVEAHAARTALLFLAAMAAVLLPLAPLVAAALLRRAAG